MSADILSEIISNLNYDADKCVQGKFKYDIPKCGGYREYFGEYDCGYENAPECDECILVTSQFGDCSGIDPRTGKKYRKKLGRRAFRVTWEPDPRYHGIVFTTSASKARYAGYKLMNRAWGIRNGQIINITQFKVVRVPRYDSEDNGMNHIIPEILFKRKEAK